MKSGQNTALAQISAQRSPRRRTGGRLQSPWSSPLEGSPPPVSPPAAPIMSRLSVCHRCAMYHSSLFYFVLAQACDRLESLCTVNFRVTLRCIVSQNTYQVAVSGSEHDPVRQSGLTRKACAHPSQLGAALGSSESSPSESSRRRGLRAFQNLLFRELNPGNDAGKWTCW